MDPLLVAQTFVSSQAPLRFRFGKIAALGSNRTVSVTVAGDSTQISGVKYLASVTPEIGAVVVLATDGVDLFVVGHIAANDLTLAPRASRSTSQSIPDATDTAISFDGVNSDAWACWSAGNATRLTAPLTGRYMAVGNVTFVANGTGFRSVWIEKDATSTVGRTDMPTALAGSAVWLNVTSQPFDMTQGDYVRLMVRQNSGGALDVSNSSTFSPSLSLIYLGP